MLTVAQIGVGSGVPTCFATWWQPRCRVKAVAELSAEPGITSSPCTLDCGDGPVEDVFEDPEVDAVIVATPVASHYDLSMTALGAGKHILVEKPLARSVAEVESIGRLAEERKRVAMVGHTFLYNAAVRFVKKLIDSGEIGDIRYIYSQRLNLGRIRSDVDALWNFAPHDVSII
jgi:predicted dehydrogenase